MQKADIVERFQEGRDKHMNSLWLIVIGIVVFVAAYVTYGSWLAREWGIDDNRKTPAYTKYDGTDYEPAKAPVLLGHHFASIAGAGPIVGPIQAAVFGWLPVLLWIILGSIFFGGVQDFGALWASMRHDGKSIGQVIESNIGRTGKKLFNVFAWLTLLLVIAAFIDICASTFSGVPQAGTSSLLFIVLAVFFGYFVYRKGTPLGVSTVIGVALLFFCIWIGLKFPLVFSADAAANKKTWTLLLLVYSSIASVTPVWILLQPRDYLNSFLLYAMIGGAVIGLFIARPTMQMPAYVGLYAGGSNYLFPMLFVTVTCGAISGFHALVGSGTSSKQIDKESDAKIIGYGAMLIEGLLAIVALVTAGYLAGDKFGELMKSGGPTAVFATGSAEFMGKLGVPVNISKTFVSLAISAFALTSLDTATRLARYIFQEFFDEQETEHTLITNKYISTAITVILGGMLTFTGYQKVWPMFGTANQLLASLALLAIAVYLIKQGKSAKMVLYPMVFMFLVTFTALALVIKHNIAPGGNMILVLVAAVLFILAIVLVKEAWNVFYNSKSVPINRKVS